MRYFAIIALLVAGCPALAAGQTSTATLNVAFSGLARLSLSSASLSFPDADPDTVPQVGATPSTVLITAKARATENGAVTLTVQASDDLRSGVSTIPASMITWTATGPGFVGGTLSAATPQLVAAWTSSGVRSGTHELPLPQSLVAPDGHLHPDAAFHAECCMRRQILAGLFVALAVAVLPAPADAQKLDLTVTPGVITFPSQDPDTMPLVAAAPVTVSYRIRQNSGPWTLTVLAGGDLNSGASTVDIANVTWVATPAPPFQNGTLSKTVAQTLASGNGNANPVRTGSVTFLVANSWTYSAGTYTQTVVFTLSAP